MENKDEKLNLNESSKQKIPSGRKINSKNLFLALALVGGLVIVVGGGISSCFSPKTVKEKELNDEFIGDKDTGNLEKEDYSKSRITSAINDKLEEDKEEERLIQEYGNIVIDDPNPMEEFMKEQELEKLKRYYEARKSPFKKNSEKVDSSVSIMNRELESSNYDYKNNSEYYDYITKGIDGTSDPNMQKEKKQWLKNAALKDFVLKNALLPSISKYEVKAGTYIPITLIGEIISDIPGGITAIVRENVYDTNTGNELVIPAGSKLVGHFNSEVSWGQTRLQAVFNRLTLPNGKSINLNAMNITDEAGQSGLSGKVDTHIGKVIGSVIMAAVVGGANGTLTNNGDNKKDENSALNGAGVAAGNKALDIVDTYAEKVLNVAPTITTPFGKRAAFLVTEDIILEKYNQKVEYLNSEE